MASTHLSRTSSTPTNALKWTFSAWLKISSIDNDTFLLDFNTDTNNRSQIGFESTDSFIVYEKVSGSTSQLITTSRVFRDPSAWYHIVVSCDRTLATSSDRTKIYVNGVQETSFASATYPTQNVTGIINTAVSTLIGKYSQSTLYFDGCLAHYHFIDGTAYDASTFGETDSTSGIWKPKTAPSVTYGTNGFFLKMENSGAMGTDSSGKGNNFTVSGTLTQNVDTPSNNFATLNPLDNPYVGQKATFSNGNLTGAGTETGFLAGASNIGVSSGKYYAEFKVTGGNTSFQVFGVIKSPVGNIGTTAPHNSTLFYGVRGNGTKYEASSETNSWTSTWTTNDIISLALDMDNNRLYIAKNGQYADGSGNYDEAFTGSPAYVTLASDQTYHFMGASISTGSGVSLTMQSNFGSGYFGTTAVASAGTAPSEGGIFEYDCPSGYQALCTKGINSF